MLYIRFLLYSGNLKSAVRSNPGYAPLAVHIIFYFVKKNIVKSWNYLNFRGVVEVLLSSGLEVNVRTSGGTALHEAALCGKVEVVRTLLDHGADLSLRDSHNNTVYELLQQFPPHVVHDITSLIKSKLIIVFF